MTIEPKFAVQYIRDNYGLVSQAKMAKSFGISTYSVWAIQHRLVDTLPTRCCNRLKKNRDPDPDKARPCRCPACNGLLEFTTSDGYLVERCRRCAA